MKIAYIIPKLKSYGSTKIAFLLSRYLSEDNDIKIFYFDKVYQRLLDFNKPSKQISPFYFEPEINNYDIVHSHGLRPDLYVWLHSNKIRGIKITTIHSFHKSELKYEYGFVQSLIFANLWDMAASKFDKAVCLTRVMQTYFKSKGFLNTKVINNGILHPTVDIRKKNQTSNKFRLVTVSNFSKIKGTEQLVKLLTYSEKYHLLIIGEGKNKTSILKQAENLGVSERLTLVGFQENPWQLVKRDDIFIFPSRSEGFGLALIEAASLEIPIICSDIPTFKEIFDDDEVLFFKLDDIDNLNRKVEYILKQKEIFPDEINSKLAKAKNKVNNCYSIELMCQKYYKLYQDTLNLSC
ncbi:MAG: glycosyltransferase family 4 protein [Calothrix sp. SM1_7_51]|nr:glycosyltransferase family 4 protein [Calothrix sp. SM1_7_51]